MDNQHTPAPWKYDGDLVTFSNAEYDNGEEGICMLFQPNCPESGEEEEQRQQEANGMLIAAAPDLLEALQTLLAVSECADETGYVEDLGFVDIETAQQRARDAITKALGHSGQNDLGDTRR